MNNSLPPKSPCLYNYQKTAIAVTRSHQVKGLMAEESPQLCNDPQQQGGWHYTFLTPNSLLNSTLRGESDLQNLSRTQDPSCKRVWEVYFFLPASAVQMAQSAGWNGS